MPALESPHNIEIELKARIQSKELVESKLESFMRRISDIDKSDEYWEIPSTDPSRNMSFRFRVRDESQKTTITFKEKTFDGNLEINREFEFAIAGKAAFAAFLERLHARFVYRKHKKGTRWEGENGLVAEVVEVSSLGLFLEVECVCENHDVIAQEEAKLRLYEVIDRCGIPRKSLEARPYSQLLGY
jgi:predicted adenylyl cyclase CyaB